MNGLNLPNLEVLVRLSHYPAKNFDFYDEARSSSTAAAIKYSPVSKAPPLPLDENVARDLMQRSAHIFAYFNNDPQWLKGCEKNIKAAIDSGDESFFLSFARLIQNRERHRGKSLFRRTGDPTPKTQAARFRFTLAICWVMWPLWLMPDPVGCAYFRKFGGFEISVENYTQLRKRLGLLQHPKQPVRSYTVDGKIILRKGRTNPKS